MRTTPWLTLVLTGAALASSPSSAAVDRSEFIGASAAKLVETWQRTWAQKNPILSQCDRWQTFALRKQRSVVSGAPFLQLFELTIIS
jgi:hypothetical protein